MTIYLMMIAGRDFSDKRQKLFPSFKLPNINYAQAMIIFSLILETFLGFGEFLRFLILAEDFW